MRQWVGRLESGLFFLSVVLLPSQLTKHFWPHFAYVYSLPIDYLAPVIHGWDLVVAGLLICWWVARPKVSPLVLAGWLVFIFSQLVSLVWAANVGAGLVRLEQLVVIGLWGLYLASTPLSRTQPLMLRGIKIALWWTSLLAIGQFLVGHSLGWWILGERQFDLSNPVIAKFNWYGQIFLRPYASFPHPNVMAGVLMVMLLLLDLDKVKINLTRLVGSLVVGLSFSRVAAGVLLVYWWRRIHYASPWLWLILVVVLPFLVVRFQSAFNFDYLSVLRREELAVVAWRLFESAPWFGVGLNNFINETASSSLISGASRFLQPAHNIVLLTMAEAGLVGVVGLLALIVWPMVRLWQQRQIAHRKLLLGCWLIIGVLGMFDHYWLTLAQGQRALWLVWGLSWSLVLSHKVASAR